MYYFGTPPTETEADKMGTQEALSTTHDVVLDTVAALDMYTGAFGSEDTTIDGVTETARDRLEVTLSNGEVYELRVRPQGSVR